MKLLGFLLPLLFSFLTLASELEFGSLNQAVIDRAGILNGSEIANLETKIRDYKERHGNQLAIYITDSLHDHAIEDYSIKLAEAWKLGSKKEDNGLLIVVAPNERKMRIEVGQGLEGLMTDFASKKIISRILAPAFKEGQYGLGLDQALDTIFGIITGDEKATRFATQRNDGVPIWVVILFFFSVSFVFPVIFRSQHGGTGSSYRRSNWGSGSGWSSGGGFGSSSSGGGSSWGGGGGGFSGGGASGDW